MNERIEQVLRALLSNVQVLNGELARLARDEQLTDSLLAVRLLKEISEAYTRGNKMLQLIAQGRWTSPP